MARLVRLLSRVGRRSWPEELIPPQERILRSYAWGIGSLLASGTAFALLASSLHAVKSPVASVPAFALAWTAGFLALPFPSGVGVREVVLLATVGQIGGDALLIAASLAHRLVTMISEALMILLSSRRG